MARKKRTGYWNRGKSTGGRHLWVWAGGGALVAIVVAFGVLAFTGDDSGGGGNASVRRATPVIIAGTTTEVEIKDTAYKPENIVVPRGTRVTWLNKDSVAHDVTDDQQKFNSENMLKGDAFTQTFAETGVFYYYCTIHHKMQGSVTVE